jgi:hypothetical protein
MERVHGPAVVIFTVLTDRATCLSRSCPAAIFCYFQLLLLLVHNKITNHLPPVATTKIITPLNL